MCVLWANVHPPLPLGSYPRGICRGRTLDTLTAPEPDRRIAFRVRFRRYLLLTAACAIAPLANPYGYRLYVHMYSFLSDPYALNDVAEYMVVDFRTPPGRAFELMLLLGAPAAVALAFERRCRSPLSVRCLCPPRSHRAAQHSLLHDRHGCFRRHLAGGNHR